MRLLLALILLVTSPTLAFAHTGHGTTMTLLAGLSHPLAGLDHVLAMLVVGIFAAVLGGRALFLVPLSFLAMMIAGFALGVAQIGLPYVELAIALSSVVIGLAAALKRPLPLAGAMALVGSFALFHGHAHGAEMPAGGDALNYALGFTAATAMICTTGVAATRTLRRLTGRHGANLVRAAAATGALMGAGVLAGWI